MYFQSSSVWVPYRINIKIIVFVGMFCASLGTDLYSPEMDKMLKLNHLSLFLLSMSGHLTIKYYNFYVIT